MGQREADDLRARAAARVRGRAGGAADVPPDPDALLVELRLHEAELEMQNEELRRTEVELQAAHDNYLDLFELAPVGYLVMGAGTQILEANLMAASLLGVNRRELIGRRFPTFIDPAEAYRFHRHHQTVF